MASHNTTIEDWLKSSSGLLIKAGISSARLDSLIMLEDATKLNRAQILAHPEITLKKSELIFCDKMLFRRLQREPLAYIRGFKEFYGYRFKVSSDVLIPRPESEAFLEVLAKLKPLKSQKLLDLGTGCGQLAICAKINHPILDVQAADLSEPALKLASINAKNLKARINFIKSDLLKNVNKFDVIFANLPYVPKNYEVSPEVMFEPSDAIFAPDKGLGLIKKLIISADKHLNQNGCLLIESLEQQQVAIAKFGALHHLNIVSKAGLISLFKKAI